MLQGDGGDGVEPAGHSARVDQQAASIRIQDLSTRGRFSAFKIRALRPFLPLNSWSKNCSHIYVACLQDCNCRKDCKLADGQLKYDNQTWQDSCQICTCQVSQHATAMT
jgi:hypothetical protein